MPFYHLILGHWNIQAKLMLLYYTLEQGKKNQQKTEQLKDHTKRSQLLFLHLNGLTCHTNKWLTHCSYFSLSLCRLENTMKLTKYQHIL